MSDEEFITLLIELRDQVASAGWAVKAGKSWTNYQQPLGTEPGRYRIGDFEIIDRRVVDPDPPLTTATKPATPPA